MLAQGRLDEAVQWHTRALDEGLLVAGSNMGLVLEEMGELARAEEMLRMAATREHLYKRMAAYNLSKFLERRGRLDEASEWMRRSEV